MDFVVGALDLGNSPGAFTLVGNHGIVGIVHDGVFRVDAALVPVPRRGDIRRGEEKGNDGKLHGVDGAEKKYKCCKRSPIGIYEDEKVMTSIGG